MNKEQLNDILEKHKKWLDDEEGGERANLIRVDLSHTDLSYAALIHTDLIGTDLSYANLRGTDLSYTDLSGADIDFSCLPLWCGSLGANFDDRQLIQIAYHLVKAGVNSNNVSDETKKRTK